MKPKRKANGVFYIDVKVPDGAGGMKRQRVGLDTRDAAHAAEQVNQWLQGIHPKHWMQGAVVEPKMKQAASSVRQNVRAAGYTIRMLLDACFSDRTVWADTNSQDTLRSNIKFLNERMGDEQVATMTKRRLQALVNEMLDDGYQPATVKRKIETLMKALRVAYEDYEDANGNPRLVALPPRPKLPVFDNRRKRTLTAREEQLVFAALDKRIVDEPQRPWRLYRAYIRILLDTAFRRGEALTLGPKSVHMVTIDTPDGEREWPFLYLPEEVTKNNKEHMVPCTQAVVDELDALNALAVGGEWFHFKGGAPWYMWTNIREDVKAMGGDIDDCLLHTLRHTCLTRLSAGGFALELTSQWANHSDVTITSKRYIHHKARALAAGLGILGTSGGETGNSIPNPEPSAKQNYHSNGGNRADAGTAH